MKKEQHSADGWRAICILLVVAAVALAYGWYQSENKRLKLLDEYNDRIAEYEEKIEELEKHNESMLEELEYYYDLH